jgi:hypothetical protein
MRIVAVLAVTVLVFSGILVGMRVVGSSGDEAMRVKEPATAGGKGPGAVEEGEPAMAEILFKSPVGVKEVLRIVARKTGATSRPWKAAFELAEKKSPISSASRPG